jgi:hypothetical protein
VGCETKYLPRHRGTRHVSAALYGRFLIGRNPRNTTCSEISATRIECLVQFNEPRIQQICVPDHQYIQWNNGVLGSRLDIRRRSFNPSLETFPARIQKQPTKRRQPFTYRSTARATNHAHRCVPLRLAACSGTWSLESSSSFWRNVRKAPSKLRWVRIWSVLTRGSGRVCEPMRREGKSVMRSGLVEQNRN